jgi:DNA polymerase-3 subunit gamma/tau
VWQKAVERFAADRPLEASSIRATRYLSRNADSLEVALPANLKHKIAFFIAPKNLPILEDVLQQGFGQPMKITFMAVDPAVTVAASESPAKVAPKATEKEPVKISEAEFKNDPLIREALQLFQARVVPSVKG